MLTQPTGKNGSDAWATQIQRNTVAKWKSACSGGMDVAGYGSSVQ